MKCQHCGMTHETKCHLVKAIEYHPDGSIKRVEYLTPADYVPAAPVIRDPGHGQHTFGPQYTPWGAHAG